MLFRAPGRRSAVLGVIVATTLLTAVGAVPAASAPATGVIRTVPGAVPVPDSYIVVLKDEAVAGTVRTDAAARLTDRYGGQVRHVYDSVLNGFELRAPESVARRLAADPAVAYVERNHRIVPPSANGARDEAGNAPDGVGTASVPWGLDRVDQRALPLDGSYTPYHDGSGALVYVIGGVIRASHVEFAANPPYVAFSPVLPCGDETYHAGLVGGATTGTAPGVQLASIEVIDCAFGMETTTVIMAFEWIRLSRTAPAVVLFPYVASGTALNTAAQRVTDAGYLVVAPAGNSSANACSFTPAGLAAVLTVGATTNTDARASYSNYGPCLDLFAPGSSIYGPWHSSDTAYNTISGTSGAAALAAGCAAALYAAAPVLPPAVVAAWLGIQATPGVVTSPGTGSPNLLLYCGP
jgi:hypothetical protein